MLPKNSTVTKLFRYLIHLLMNFIKALTFQTKDSKMVDTHEPQFVGSIDQGTTSSRFLIFNKAGEPVASHQIEFQQIYPKPG